MNDIPQNDVAVLSLTPPALPLLDVISRAQTLGKRWRSAGGCETNALNKHGDSRLNQRTWSSGRLFRLALRRCEAAYVVG